MKEEYKQDMPSLPRVMIGMMIIVMIVVFGAITSFATEVNQIKQIEKDIEKATWKTLENSDSLELL